MTALASPNFNDRASDIKVQYIVLHYTDMQNAASALARLCEPAAKVSAHYMVDEDGRVIQLVDEAKRAWHAGESYWRGITDMNSASIGIELVNPGHSFGYQPFPTLQIIALKKLMHAIISRHDMHASLAPLAHSDIAPSRKRDPGELFPWQELADDGLGIWPKVQNSDYGPPTETEVRILLGSIGYQTMRVQDSLLAFQRHYNPDCLTGIADDETVARLRSLKRMGTV